MMDIRGLAAVILKARILEDSIWTKKEDIAELTLLLNAEQTTHNLEELNALVEKIRKYND